MASGDDLIREIKNILRDTNSTGNEMFKPFPVDSKDKFFHSFNVPFEITSGVETYGEVQEFYNRYKILNLPFIKEEQKGNEKIYKFNFPTSLRIFNIDNMEFPLADTQHAKERKVERSYASFLAFASIWDMAQNATRMILELRTNLKDAYPEIASTGQKFGVYSKKTQYAFICYLRYFRDKSFMGKYDNHGNHLYEIKNYILKKAMMNTFGRDSLDNQLIFYIITFFKRGDNYFNKETYRLMVEQFEQNDVDYILEVD